MRPCASSGAMPLCLILAAPFTSRRSFSCSTSSRMSPEKRKSTKPVSPYSAPTEEPTSAFEFPGGPNAPAKSSSTSSKEPKSATVERRDEEHSQDPPALLPRPLFLTAGRSLSALRPLQAALEALAARTREPTGTVEKERPTFIATPASPFLYLSLARAPLFPQEASRGDSSPSVRRQRQTLSLARPRAQSFKLPRATSLRSASTKKLPFASKDLEELLEPREGGDLQSNTRFVHHALENSTKHSHHTKSTVEILRQKPEPATFPPGARVTDENSNQRAPAVVQCDGAQEGAKEGACGGGPRRRRRFIVGSPDPGLRSWAPLSAVGKAAAGRDGGVWGSGGRGRDADALGWRRHQASGRGQRLRRRPS
mmetsp:Transcript_1107/g.3069  ORF Transcript_1107/g.3069 Transcript_1107/m.3069 type:complete len:368 (+) Transcript_1107:787-1890(+)